MKRTIYQIKGRRLHVWYGCRDGILKYLFEAHGIKPEHLWEKYPIYEVLRHGKI